MFEELSPSDKGMLGIIVFIVLAVVVKSVPLTVMLMVLGFMFMRSGRNMEQRMDRYLNGVWRDRARANVRQMRPCTVNAKKFYAHALTAVRNVRLDPENLPVLPVDLGMISYHGTASPVIHRQRPVKNDCDYIQPFVHLWLSEAAIAKIRFEIVDAQEKMLFFREDSYQLKRGHGRNLVTPAARLPIHDEQAFDDRWALLIYVDNMLIAEYFFTWKLPEEIDFESSVGEDGEITSELEAVLKEVQLEYMSLDELLGSQTSISHSV